MLVENCSGLFLLTSCTWHFVQCLNEMHWETAWPNYIHSSLFALIPLPAANHHGLIFIQIVFSSSVYTYISANASYLQTATSHCFVLACKAFDFLFTSLNFLSVICTHHVHLSPCCFVLPSPLSLPMGAVNRSSPRRQHNAGRVYFCVERLCL